MSDTPQQPEQGPSTPITAQERARRRRAVDAARHSSEMEGARSDEPTRADQEAYVRGELTIAEALERIRRRQGPLAGG